MTIDENRMTEVVTQSVAETFEGMAFIIINPEMEAKSQAVIQTDEWIWASVAVDDPVQADFTLVLSVTFANEIVEVLFGEVEEESELGTGKIADVLKEIVNTMVGRCMNKLVSENLSFSLGLPRFGKGWPTTNEGVKVYHFSTDEGKPLAAVVDIKITDPELSGSVG